MGLGAVPPTQGVQLGRGVRGRLHAARAAGLRSDLIPAARRTAWIVFLASLLFFAYGASARGLWESDEHRIAEVTRQIAKPGGDWIVMHLQGDPYTHKPPLVPWIAAALHGLGMDLALASKAPSLLGSALAVLATYLIGRRLYSERAGLVAALVLATAAEFAWIGRRAQYDPLLAGFTTLALWCFVRSRFPAGDETPRPWRDAVLGALFVGLAGMCKGPAALAFTVVPIVAFAVAAREGRSLLTPRLAALAAALLPAGLWLAAATARAGVGYARDLVLGHGVGHAAGEVDKLEAAWFYLVALPKGFLPWTLFAPAAVLALTSWRREGERRADLFVTACVVAPFLVMSAIPAKRELYLLPLYPASAIAVAKLAHVDEARLASAAFRVPRIAVVVLGGLAGAGVLALSVAALARWDGWIAARVPDWNVCIERAGAIRVAFAAFAGGAMVFAALRSMRAPSPGDAFRRTLSLPFVATLLVAFTVLPGVDAVASPRRFYEEARGTIGDAPLLRYRVDDFAPHWVLGRDEVPYVRDKDALARLLAAAGPGAFVVAERDTVEERGLPAGLVTVSEARGPSRAKDLLLLRRD